MISWIFELKLIINKNGKECQLTSLTNGEKNFINGKHATV